VGEYIFGKRAVGLQYSHGIKQWVFLVAFKK
jgi:hypothetical protein